MIGLVYMIKGYEGIDHLSYEQNVSRHIFFLGVVKWYHPRLGISCRRFDSSFPDQNFLVKASPLRYWARCSKAVG